MGFLDNYEASLARLTRWHETYPNGRIETHILHFDPTAGYVMVQAMAFKDAGDDKPAGIDYAYGFVNAYQPNMKRWFVEDTVTSAIMRVQQLVMGGAERTTRETMQQIEQAKPTAQTYDYWTTKFDDVPSYATAAEAEQAGVPSLASSLDDIAQQLGGQLVEEKPRCQHGTRVWKTGESAKTGKAWGGYFCTEKAKASQCEPMWYQLGATGQWVVRLP